MKLKRVYDDRTPGVTLFEGSAVECMQFVIENYDENDSDFEHIWIG